MYSSVMGQYYLKQRDYKDGVKVFEERLKQDPQDHTASYYVGRYYLALNKPDEAMPYLKKAAELDPQNAEYQFWIGVGYWAKFEFDKEKEAYEKTLALDPDHISANLYLGHGYTDGKQWEKALEKYDKVIKLDKYNPEALYNRAVALGGLGRDKEEIAALKKFLKYYPDGSLAMRAALRLNLQGDFSYRNFIIGKRNVTLRTMAFKPGTNDLEQESKESLHVISAMMKEKEELALHVVAYKDGDAAAAKARAKAVRDYILAGNPGFDPKRLPLSWFGTAEIVEKKDKTFTLDDSVTFITVVR
ncbi:tetratricopeptide repeat protein [Pseudodesulfovibrio sp. zrk46]|nr:tetratricopeptide repeat protein [Pseudodesulfovibrio sp. zrk46]